MDTPVFDWIRTRWPDRAAAWDLGSRPVRSRRSDDAVLDPDTAIVASCEPGIFRSLIRVWPDGVTAEELAEAVHQLDLEQAAQPPVIEVTVTTPPDGIPRLEMERLVSDTVREITGPMPALSPDTGPRRRGKVLMATRRARNRLGRRLPDDPLPVSEDDTPTVELPAVRGDGFELVEVHLP